MKAEPQSLIEMGETEVLKYWPNLNQNAYHKTSDECKLYNCVAWVNRIKTENLDFSIDEEGDPVTDHYYLSPAPYIEYFMKFGFERCENASIKS